MFLSVSRSVGVQTDVFVLRMWFNSRQTYSQVKSARKVHEALIYPNEEAKFGTPE